MFKITIIISMNDKKFNDKFFNNLLKQTIGFVNIQIILVNYSFKSTNDHIQKYTSKYDNIISISMDKKYYDGMLYNVAMKHAVSEYVMFLESSDILRENACELLYNAITKDDDIDLVKGFQSENDANYFEKKINKLEDNTIDLRINPLEENPIIIAELTINTILFKKSLIKTHHLKFLEGNIYCRPVFVFNSILNSNKIKYINMIILDETCENSIPLSKNRLISYLDIYYEMFYISNEKNKTNFFVKNVLFEKLSNFLKTRLLNSNLSIDDIIYILEYSRPLFELCNRYGNFRNELNDLFENIANGKYEKILLKMHKKIPKQNEIKISSICDSNTYNSYKFECDFTKLPLNISLKKFKENIPHLFLITSSCCEMISEIELNNIRNILKFCAENKIPSIFWENDYKNFYRNFEKILLNFDYIFTINKHNIFHYVNKGHENVNYLPYASQPKLFNPINKHPREKNSVQYVGKWDENNPNKNNIMSAAFNKIITEGYNLKIYDECNLNDLTQSNFPKCYNNNLNYCNPQKIPNLYKETEIELLINEPYDPYAPYKHELFELMSSNTLIFSNFSKSIYNLFKNNIYYVGYDNSYFTKENLEKIKNENLHNVLENHTYKNRFKQILDTINFKYIPHIKHIIIFYRLNNLNDLHEIYNHFYSINYPYKEIKIITREDYLYLPFTILESQLINITLEDNYYFCFADLNLDADFVKYSLLHFSYIENNIGIKEDIDKKFLFYKTKNLKNIIFNSKNYEEVILNKESYFDVYYLNNFKIKVSVIIPVYNVENYLRECLDSVINQTLKDIEIICVNDGSSDSSLKILKEYEKKDSRIKIISQNNRGPGGARNTGLNIAQGKYIYFIDGDDIIELNGLKEMYFQAELKNLDMLKFNLMTFDDKTREKKSLYQRVKPAFLKELGDVIFNYETIGSDVYTLSPNMQSTFFKRDIIKNIKFPENIIFEDNIFLIESLLKSNRVYYYDKFLSNKRERENSITNSNGEQFSDVIEIRNQIIDLAKKYNHYDDFKFTLYSRKYMFIKLLFLQTDEKYKSEFFNKIKLDCINKKVEYEKEKLFEILDEKSITIFNAGLTSNNYKEFEEKIKNA